MIRETDLEAVRAFLAVTEQQGVRTMLVGAIARELAFDIPRGINPPRQTLDWDFAASVPSWRAYEALLDGLVGVRFRLRRDTGRVHHPNGALIDVIPVGGVTGPDALVRWPGGSGPGLDVTGFLEAWESARPTEAGAGVMVELPDVAALVVLKLVAWANRRDSKDLKDVIEQLTAPDSIALAAVVRTAARPPSDEQIDALTRKFRACLAGMLTTRE